MYFSLISNFLKREITNSKDTTLPVKKKRKLPKSRSRKRPRPKTLNDKSGPKVKKVRKKEAPSKSPEIEVVNEDNEDVQSVSRYFNIYGTSYIYLCFIVYFNY
jgi:hypothetical protein